MDTFALDVRAHIAAFKEDMKHFFSKINWGESFLDAKAIGFMNEIDDRADALVEAGRISVLQDFDKMCLADAFIGYTDDEWKAIKKFFARNKAATNWNQ